MTDVINYNHFEVTGLDSKVGWYRRDRMVLKKLGVGKSHEKASFHNPNLKITEIVEQMFEVFPATGKTSAMMLGDVGSGKTFGMLAYFVGLVPAYIDSDKVQSVGGKFMSAYDLAYMISQGRQESAELKRLERVKYLFIDDLGNEPVGWKGADFEAHFGNLFNKRNLDGLPTFFTGNYQFKELEAQYGARFADRLMEDTFIYETVANSMRRKVG